MTDPLLGPLRLAQALFYGPEKLLAKTGEDKKVDWEGKDQGKVTFLLTPEKLGDKYRPHPSDPTLRLYRCPVCHSVSIPPLLYRPITAYPSGTAWGGA